MAGVTVRGQVEARWHEEQLSASVSSARELARVAVRLLVEDLGADDARQLLRDELAEYRLDYKGAGVDERNARRDSGDD